MPSKIHRSSGDVFRDLGFDRADSANLRLRSQLMIELSQLVRSRRLTQAQAAKIFGVSQPRVSDLMRGEIDRFSVDTLVAMLGSAGLQVSLVVKRGRGAA
ncbi:MAG: helix-turn-helix domain-containing protein [Gemmatimonadales bacterium]